MVQAVEPLGERPPRILALFGARVIFGQERANEDALASLRASGCAVMCLVREERWPEVIELRARLEARGLATVPVAYIDLPRRGWILKTMARNPCAFVRSNISMVVTLRRFRPTHIHGFNPFYVANFLPALLWSSVPLIYRVGDRPILHNWFWRMLWRFVIRRTSRFVADSKYVRDEIVASGVDPTKVRVLYAPPPKRMPQAAPADLPRSAREPDVFRFVYVGQIQPQKGVDLLVDAFRTVVRRYPTARLLVAGPITAWRGHQWARDLRAAVMRDPATASAVTFLGHVEAVPELLSQCHVHVCPSVAEEPYGLVVVEAKSVGIPSIAFPSGGLKELVRSGVDGILTKEKTTEALSDAMLSYISHPRRASEDGEAARRSLDELDLATFDRRWLEIYGSSLGASRTS